MQTEWVAGEVRDGSHSERVHALVGPHVLGDPDDDSVEGVFEPSLGLDVGRAVRLCLDDGRDALVVVVSDVGRFLSVGPLV
jgi:hypothetical protein